MASLSSLLVKIRHISSLPILLALAVGVVDAATDLYIPTMPFLIRYFATTEEMAALTISLYLFSFCLSGPVYGPLADAWGRRYILLAGIFIFSFFGLLCAFSCNIYMLILFRFLQGLGGGSAWVLGLAILKDIYQKEESVNILAFFGMLTALTPAIAPILGGYIGTLWGWQANFYVLAGWSFLMLIALIYILPETLPPAKRQLFSLKRMKDNYKILLCSVPFMAYSLISAVIFAGLWSYISLSPFFFIKVLGLPVNAYGYYALILVVMYMFGTLLNRFLVRVMGIDHLLGVGIAISLGGGACLSGVTLFCDPLPLLITGAMSIYCFGMGIVFSNTSTQAMEVFPQMGGSSSAVLGSLEMLIAALGVFLAGKIYQESLFSVSICVLLFAFLAEMIFLFLLKSKHY